MKTNANLSDEVKKLIQLNISTEDFQSVPGEFGQNENGKYGYIIDWDNLPERFVTICEKNMKIIAEILETRNKRNDVLVGDFLVMPDGSESRVTYCHDEGVQDGGGSDSFFLFHSGNAAYSGALNGLKPMDKIKPTGQTKKALFWIFSQNSAGANRSFHFYIDVKVWKIESMFKTAYVCFDDHKYNYHTSVNGLLQDEEIKKSFVDHWFNLGAGEKDNMQKCIRCEVYY